MTLPAFQNAVIMDLSDSQQRIPFMHQNQSQQSSDQSNFARGFNHLAVIIGMIALAIASRLIPHPWNVTAVTAVALFGGTMLRDWRLALIVPLSAMWLSDLVLNNLIYQQFFDGFVLWHSDLAWTYAAVALTVLLGRTMLMQQRGALRIAGISVTASSLFFVITNFGVWASGLLYPLTASGLLTCYVAALPFYAQQLVGDLVWCGVLFGAYALIAQHFPMAHAQRQVAFKQAH